MEAGKLKLNREIVDFPSRILQDMLKFVGYHGYTIPSAIKISIRLEFHIRYEIA